MTPADVTSAEAFARKQREALARRFKLVDERTGELIALPARRKCWDGAEIVIVDFTPPRRYSGQGIIITDMNEEFVPSVCDCKILEFPPTAEEIAASAGALK